MRPDLTKLLHTMRHVRVAPVVVVLWACDPNHVPPGRGDAAATAPSQAWLEHPEQLDSTDQCARALRAQLRDLGAETLSVSFRFERYPVLSISRARQAPLDASSLRSARTFRTKLREALDTAGVNFAGHYAIVEVGMTGWGPNYWIVDRTIGRAFEFPYKATYLDFTDSSRLVIMDSKNAIMRALAQMADYQEACSNIGGPLRHTDLRPFYFRWHDGRLEQLAPTGVIPPPNTFWKDY
jgi:hypothetical protein